MKVKTGREYTRGIVRARDNYTCQDCGLVWEDGNRAFDVHHLNGLCGKNSRGYDKVSEIEGLVTLCHKCHFNRPEHGSGSNGRPKSKEIQERNAQIKQLVANGMMKKDIAKIIDLTPQRIGQIARC